MKISCTENEKELIIELFSGFQDCIFEEDQCPNNMTCAECVKKHIEWNIEE